MHCNLGIQLFFRALVYSCRLSTDNDASHCCMSKRAIYEFGQTLPTDNSASVGKTFVKILQFM